MIGAIVLTLRHKPGVKRQNISDQVARNPSTAIEVRQVKRAALGGAQPGPVEHLPHGPVAQADRPARVGQLQQELHLLDVEDAAPLHHGATQHQPGGRIHQELPPLAGKAQQGPHGPQRQVDGGRGERLPVTPPSVLEPEPVGGQVGGGQVGRALHPLGPAECLPALEPLAHGLQGPGRAAPSFQVVEIAQHQAVPALHSSAAWRPRSRGWHLRCTRRRSVISTRV